MKKKIFILIIILLIIGCIPIHTIVSDRPYEEWKSIFYKYIKYNYNTIYDFQYKDEIVLFPMNFIQSSDDRYNRQIHQLHATSNNNTVELLVGTYEWNKEIGDAIFPIARNYKEILEVKNNEEILLNPYELNNIEINYIVLYDVITTNTIKDKVDFSKNSITFHDLDTGEYIISIHTSKDNNKVEYSFKIKIED